jgi:hypothetical protein
MSNSACCFSSVTRRKARLSRSSPIGAVKLEEGRFAIGEDYSDGAFC